MRCPLCGLEFSEAEAKRVCQGCPLDSGCRLICCPNCGYQIPDEPAWLMRLRHRRHRHRGAPAGVGRHRIATCTLAALEPRQMAEIVRVCSEDAMTLRKLMALGLLPGVRLMVLRRFPCYLLQIGHAQIALDRPLAETILVTTAESSSQVR